MAQNYELLHIMRLQLMRELQHTKKQRKISDFFKPTWSRSESETSYVSLASTSSPDLPSVSRSSTSSRMQDIHTVTPEPPEKIFDSDDE